MLLQSLQPAVLAQPSKPKQLPVYPVMLTLHLAGTMTTTGHVAAFVRIWRALAPTS